MYTISSTMMNNIISICQNSFQIANEPYASGRKVKIAIFFCVAPENVNTVTR